MRLRPTTWSTLRTLVPAWDPYRLALIGALLILSIVILDQTRLPAVHPVSTPAFLRITAPLPDPAARALAEAAVAITPQDFILSTATSPANPALAINGLGSVGAAALPSPTALPTTTGSSANGLPGSNESLVSASPLSATGGGSGSAIPAATTNSATTTSPAITNGTASVGAPPPTVGSSSSGPVASTLRTTVASTRRLPPLFADPLINLAWQRPLSLGAASLSAWGPFVFLCDAAPLQRGLRLQALQRDQGTVLWTVTIPCDSEGWQGGPAQPQCDGSAVFLSSLRDQQLVLHAFSMQGVPLWTRAVGPFSPAKPRPLPSPVLAGSLVVIAADHRGGLLDRWTDSSYLAAVHRLSGDLIWRALRPNAESAGVPVYATIAERPQLLLSGRRSLISYHPETGRELWRVRWSAERTHGPVAVDERHVYVTARFPESETLCVRADGRGDVTATHVVWRERGSATDDFPPIVSGSMVLVMQREGQLSALDRRSGRVLWRTTLPGPMVAPPIVLGARLLVVNQSGMARLVALDQRGTLLAEQPLGVIGSTPIVTGPGQMLMRSAQGLVSFTNGPTLTAEQPPPPFRRL